MAQNNFGNNRNPRENTKAPVVNITSENYVDVAEDVIANRLDRDNRGNISLTTSKIRNILAMVTELYDDVIHFPGENLDVDLVERIQYLRLRVAYEAGRERSVKDFVEKSSLLDQVKKIGKSKKEFLLFCKYMEALVAYHRFYGGRD